MKILNKNYNIDNKLNKNIILISDIHYNDCTDLNRLNFVLKEIRKHRPDYICIPGDIINKANIDNEKEFIEWLKKLSKITKVIISLGNHEFYVNKNKDIYNLNKELIKKIKDINNLYLLDNENVVIDNINFIGLTIEYNKKNKLCYEEINKIKIYKKYYNILLCHNPLNICDKKILKDKNIDLILCGHMHGGVLPNFLRKLFKNRGLISPNKGLFPKYAYGYLKIENSNIIISSGIRVLPFKLLNKLFRMEIVKIQI